METSKLFFWFARLRQGLLVSALALASISAAAAQYEPPPAAPCDEGEAGTTRASDDCPKVAQSYEESEARRVRAERRASVAALGTFIATMSALAVPATFIPLGVASFFRRVHVLDESKVSRIRHNSYRARVRVLPLLGMTALSVSSLSSRFWWAGVLTASCGVSSDVLLAQYWRHGGSTRRAIGIATASVGAVAGLVLDIETLGFSDVGAWRGAFMPTIRVGVAQLEVGLGGRF